MKAPRKRKYRSHLSGIYVTNEDNKTRLHVVVRYGTKFAESSEVSVTFPGSLSPRRIAERLRWVGLMTETAEERRQDEQTEGGKTK